MLEVVESFVAGKYDDPARCEDAVVITPGHVAVIDGATTEPGHEIDGRAPGRFAMEVLAEAIRRLPADVGATQAIALLSGALAEALVRHGVAVGRLASACVLLVSGRHREVWRVGNSTFVIGGTVHAQRWRLAEVPAELRSVYLRALLRSREVTVDDLLRRDPAQELIAPLLRVEHVFRNAPDAGELAYSAIDGRAVPEAFVERVPVPAGAEVVLASDGYPTVLGTLSDTEEHLRAGISADPLRIDRHPAVRGVGPGMVSFDDRAYARVRLSRSATGAARPCAPGPRRTR